MVLKQVNNISIDIDPYCCIITIKRVDRIGPVAIDHVPKELSRFIFDFIQERDSVTHENKAIYSTMEIIVRKQVEKMKRTFDVETLAEENCSENSPEENPRCAEDKEKQEKEQAEQDFTIEE